MRERLLNPKRMKTKLEAFPVIIVEGISYRNFTKEYTHTDDGSCQCFKDCDCSGRAGLVTKKKITWYRNKDFDNTDKCFYSEPYTPNEYSL